MKVQRNTEARSSNHFCIPWKSAPAKPSFLWTLLKLHSLLQREVLWQNDDTYERQSAYRGNSNAHSRYYCCCGNAISVSYSECVCSLGYLACKAHAPFCHLWRIWIYHIFPHYLMIGRILEKKFFVHKTCVLIFSTRFEPFLILRRIHRDIITEVQRPSFKVSLFLSYSNETLIFSTYCRKIPKYQISWNFGQWEPSCSIRTERQTWRS